MPVALPAARPVEGAAAGPHRLTLPAEQITHGVAETLHAAFGGNARRG